MRVDLATAVLLVSGAAMLVPTIASAQSYQRYCETRYRNVRVPYQDQVCYGYGGCKYVTKYRYDRQPYQYCYNKPYYGGGGGYGGY